MFSFGYLYQSFTLLLAGAIKDHGYVGVRGFGRRELAIKDV
jgi:hypothetical protein